MAAYMFQRVQAIVGKPLSLSTILHASTIQELSRLLDQDSTHDFSSVITVLNRTGQHPALFFVPGAGGSVVRLEKLARNLGKEQPVYAFEMPGIDGRPAVEPAIHTRAAYFKQIMKQLQPEGPYYLAGYSWGGTVAFELASQLLQDGDEVAFLAIIDVPAFRPVYRKLRRLSDRLAQWRKIPVDQYDAHYLETRDRLFQLDYFIQRMQKGPRIMYFKKMLARTKNLKEWLGKRNPVKKDFWSRFDLEVERAVVIRENDRATRLYHPSEYPGNVILFRSNHEHLNPNARSLQPGLGWEQYVSGELKIIRLQGDHLGILREPAVLQLAEALQAGLQAARQNLS
jgi:thioesterase domain-containing protein